MSGGNDLAEVPESSARGEVATVYEDIRTTQGLGLVNLVWRHLATRPAALEWVWGTLRPIYAEGIAAAHAQALPPPDPGLPPVPRAALEALGLGTERDRILGVLDAYNRGNGLNLVALGALVLPAGDRVGPASTPPAAAPAGADPLPPIPALESLSPEVRELVLTLNRFGTGGEPGPVVASLYRHLALWPAYLVLAWSQLAPLAENDRLDALSADTQARAGTLAARVAAWRDASVPEPDRDTRHFAETAVARFVETAICRMVPIGRLLAASLTARDTP